MSSVISGKKYTPTGNGTSNSTIKGCIPFLDSLSIGYFAVLSNDIYVNINSEGLQSFVWNRGGNLIMSHDLNQISKQQVPDGFSVKPYKFVHNWSIQLPKGYSALFTHPLNREDLPFHTLSGVVDSDIYYEPVHFPFFIKKDFEGVIEAGTPIAQVIPFKRESWNHKILAFDEKRIDAVRAGFQSKIYRVYKKYFWQKKDYN